jgi:hypothetical protein
MPFPEGPDRNSVEALPEANAGLAVIDHDAAGETLAGGLLEFPKASEV